MSEVRKIRFQGKEFGAFKIDVLYRKMVKGDFDDTAESFSLKKNQWVPVAGILDDFEEVETTEEKVMRWKKMGMKNVDFLPSRNTGDCPPCKAIAGQIFPIDEVPVIPPEGCSCIPWCMLVPGVTKRNNM